MKLAMAHDDETEKTPRHPVRADMAPVWKAERAVRAKRIELKKTVARLNHEVTELENEFEKACFDLAIECGMSPGLQLDTDRMKWKIQINPGEREPVYKTIDVEKWKHGEYDQ